MNICRFIVTCTLILLGVGTAIAYTLNAQAPITNRSLASRSENADPVDDGRMRDDIELISFEFQREGAATPEVAAETLCRACATASPTYFIQHQLVGVCEEPINTLQIFAECLHSTKFRHGEESFTVYDFPPGKGIDRKKTFRTIASQDFDLNNEEVERRMRFQAASTYSGRQFKSIDVVAESYDGLEYRTRIVVARVNDRWYAMPRCHRSAAFYEIADAMGLPSPEAKEAK
ncbi:MAG: hypothetical protein KF861_21630 [Planctomycetaceae bacterium]|nr:hypothetical protein [Planctomycetaceae bacterium]